MLVESKWPALSEWPCDEVVAEIGLGSGNMGGLLQLQPFRFIYPLDMGVTKQHGAGAILGRFVFVHDHSVGDICPFPILAGKRRIRLVWLAGLGMHEHLHLFVPNVKVTRGRFLQALGIGQVWKYVVVIVGIHQQSDTDLMEIANRPDIHPFVALALGKLVKARRDTDDGNYYDGKNSMPRFHPSFASRVIPSR